VLFFYPLDFTFVCPSELIAFDHRLDEMPRMVDALQFTEERGEVCPAGWQKGGGLFMSPSRRPGTVSQRLFPIQYARSLLHGIIVSPNCMTGP